jgi:hypothetical protein
VRDPPYHIGDRFFFNRDIGLFPLYSIQVIFVKRRLRRADRRRAVRISCIAYRYRARRRVAPNGCGCCERAAAEHPFTELRVKVVEQCLRS